MLDLNLASPHCDGSGTRERMRHPFKVAATPVTFSFPTPLCSCSS